ncbi:hypothetical protein VTO73DRAFT_2368 [Trametes versicolor]
MQPLEAALLSTRRSYNGCVPCTAGMAFMHHPGRFSVDFEPEKGFLKSAPNRGLFFDFEIMLTAGEDILSAFAGSWVIANFDFVSHE